MNHRMETILSSCGFLRKSKTESPNVRGSQYITSSSPFFKPGSHIPVKELLFICSSCFFPPHPLLLFYPSPFPGKSSHEGLMMKIWSKQLHFCKSLSFQKLAFSSWKGFCQCSLSLPYISHLRTVTIPKLPGKMELIFS